MPKCVVLTPLSPLPGACKVMLGANFWKAIKDLLQEENFFLAGDIVETAWVGRFAVALTAASKRVHAFGRYPYAAFTGTTGMTILERVVDLARSGIGFQAISVEDAPAPSSVPVGDGD